MEPLRAAAKDAGCYPAFLQLEEQLDDLEMQGDELRAKCTMLQVEKAEAEKVPELRPESPKATVFFSIFFPDLSSPLCGTSGRCVHSLRRTGKRSWCSYRQSARRSLRTWRTNGLSSTLR